MDKITKIEGYVLKLEEISFEEFKYINTILFEDIPAEDRVRYTDNYANIFWQIISKLDEKSKVLIHSQIYELYKLVRTLIKDFSLSKIETHEKAFVMFLYMLENIDRFDETDYLSLYKVFVEEINQVRWIFDLKIDDKYMFNLTHILVKTIDNFEPNKNKLLTLTISLNLSDWVDHNELKKSQINEKINSIIENYDLEFLRMIKDQNAKPYPNNWIKNYLYNNVMIVLSESELLIRNNDEKYFDDVSVQKEKQTNFYYVKENLDNYRIVSFSEMLRHKNSLELLQNIFNNETFNVLDEGMFLFSNNKIRLLNKYCSNDSYIITANDVLESSIENFRKASYKKKNIRTIILNKCNHFDIVTYDFLLELFYISDKKIDIVGALNQPSNDFLQNRIIENIFNSYLDDRDFEGLEVFLSKLHDIYEFSSVFRENDKSIIGTILFMPFSLELKYNLKEFISKLYMIDFNFELGEVKHDYDDHGNNKYSFMTENGEIKEIDIDKYDFQTNFYILNKENNIIEKYDKRDRLIGLYKNLLMLSQLGLKKQELSNINKNDIYSLQKMIYCAGLSRVTLNNYNTNYDSNETESIILYKLFNHIRIYKLDKNKVSGLNKLLRDNHYIDPLFNNNTVDNFFNSLFDKTLSDSKTIAIFLKNSWDDSSIVNLFYEYKNKSGVARENKKLIVDQEIFKSKIKTYGEKFYYDCQEISKLIIITDLVLTGSSIRSALNCYKGECEGECKGKECQHFNPKVGEEKISYIQQMIDSNKVEIIFYSIYGLNKAKENLSSLLTGNLSLEIYSSSSKNFTFTEEINSVINEIYGKTYSDSLNNKISSFELALRYKNLPNKSIFDSKLINGDLVCSLFLRRAPN